MNTWRISKIIPKGCWLMCVSLENSLPTGEFRSQLTFHVSFGARKVYEQTQLVAYKNSTCGCGAVRFYEVVNDSGWLWLLRKSRFEFCWLLSWSVVFRQFQSDSVNVYECFLYQQQINEFLICWQRLLYARKSIKRIGAKKINSSGNWFWTNFFIILATAIIFFLNFPSGPKLYEFI